MVDIKPENEIKPPDRWFIHPRDRKKWLPPTRAMSTWTYVPLTDILQKKTELGALSAPPPIQFNQLGFGYLFFGIGQKREDCICELNMTTFTWRRMIGTNNFGTPWSPGPRAGHVASYLGNGRIFLYGGEGSREEEVVRGGSGGGGGGANEAKAAAEALAQMKKNQRKSKKVVGCPTSNREFVQGDVNMLVYDVVTNIWERYQPRISPGPRYLPSLTKITKRPGNHMLLFGGASQHVQKKKKKDKEKKNGAAAVGGRRDAALGEDASAEMEEVVELFKERTGGSFDATAIRTSGFEPKHSGRERKEEDKDAHVTPVSSTTFASEWRLKNDVWCLDTDTMAWWLPAVAGHPPPPRMGHTATETATGSLFFIGGIKDLPKQKTPEEEEEEEEKEEEEDGESNKSTMPINPEDYLTIFELCVTSSPMMWTRIQSHGFSPGRRMLHTSLLSLWDNSNIYVFGGSLDDQPAGNNLLMLNTMTSEWTVQKQIGYGKNQSNPSVRYGHCCLMTDNHAGRPSGLSSSQHPRVSSSLEQREVKMWILGGTGRNGFEPLHVYELALNPQPCLLEERGRWNRKVKGHWAYQRQRLLAKPFGAWREHVATQRRTHVLAEHDDILAARLPNQTSKRYTLSYKTSMSYLNQDLSEKINVQKIISCGFSFKRFQEVLNGPRIRNRIMYMSSGAANHARKLQIKQQELDDKIGRDGKKRQDQRIARGKTEERNHESGSASVLENMMASALLGVSGGVHGVSGGGSSLLLSPGERRKNDLPSSTGRPASSPGRARLGTSKNRPTTAPSQGLRPVRSYVRTSQQQDVTDLPTKEPKFISATRRKTMFDNSHPQFGIKNAHSSSM